MVFAGRASSCFPCVCISLGEALEHRLDGLSILPGGAPQIVHWPFSRKNCFGGPLFCVGRWCGGGMLGPGARFHQNPCYCCCCTPLLLYPSTSGTLAGEPNFMYTTSFLEKQRALPKINSCCPTLRNILLPNSEKHRILPKIRLCCQN